MTTQELKNKIEKVLGNNIRCLLPSYWWKNLFHSVADRIDEVEQKIDGIEIPDGLPIVSSIAELDSLNLNKGRVASVVDGIGFSQCYQPTDEEISSLASSSELYSKLTRVENIDIKNNPLEEGEVGVAILVDFKGIETELSYLAIICFKQNGPTLKYAQGVISGQDVILLLSPGNIERLNKILSEYDMRFVTAKLDGLFEGEPEASLAALDKEFAINIDVDAYIKGDSWERLAKERDLEGIGGGTINAEGVEIRELRTNYNLSDEDKAYNIETVELYKEGKALVIVPVEYSQTSTERTDRMMAPFFVDLHTGDSTKLATFRFLNPLMDETDPFEKGFIRETTVVISNDGGVSGTERSFYDDAMSDTSTKAVQNKVIKKYIDDATANNADSELSETSENAVQNKAVTLALDKKQDKEDIYEIDLGECVWTNEPVDRLEAALITYGKPQTGIVKVTGKIYSSFQNSDVFGPHSFSGQCSASEFEWDENGKLRRVIPDLVADNGVVYKIDQGVHEDYLTLIIKKGGTLYIGNRVTDSHIYSHYNLFLVNETDVAETFSVAYNDPSNIVQPLNVYTWSDGVIRVTVIYNGAIEEWQITPTYRYGDEENNYITLAYATPQLISSVPIGGSGVTFYLGNFDEETETFTQSETQKAHNARMFAIVANSDIIPSITIDMSELYRANLGLTSIKVSENVTTAFYLNDEDALAMGENSSSIKLTIADTDYGVFPDGRLELFSVAEEV